MSDPERLAIEKAIAGDFTDAQLLLLESCDQLRGRIAGEIPHDLQQILGVDDVIQEICVEAIRDIHNFKWRGPGSFQSWLNEIARTCVLDLVRQHRRLKRGGNRIGIPLSWVDVVEMAFVNPNGISAHSSPSRIARTNEAMRAVQAAVAQLPEVERQAMRLYYLQQWTTENVAMELGITPGAVRALLQRGRKRLAKLMGPASHWLSHGG